MHAVSVILPSVEIHQESPHRRAGWPRDSLAGCGLVPRGGVASVGKQDDLPLLVRTGSESFTVHIISSLQGCILQIKSSGSI